MIGTDPRTDLALIKVEGTQTSPMRSSLTRQPRIGDWVLAVGNPFGLGGTVTAGIVSARGRDIGAGPYDDFLQIDAPVNKGNSGGPTFDTEGSVIGVNTAIFSPSGGSRRHRLRHPGRNRQERGRPAQGQGRGDARLDRRADPTGDPGTSPTASASRSAEGALVAEPQKDSPAMKAGIQAGDVITAVDGKPVKDARDLARRISSMPPNTTVKLAIIRSGSREDHGFDARRTAEREGSLALNPVNRAAMADATTSRSLVCRLRRVTAATRAWSWPMSIPRDRPPTTASSRVT